VDHFFKGLLRKGEIPLDTYKGEEVTTAVSLSWTNEIWPSSYLTLKQYNNLKADKITKDGKF